MRDQQAAIGVGTMIVFVATALVAAVAAGILLSAGSDVQQQAPDDERAFHVAQVTGRRDAPSDAVLKGLDIYVVADAPVDLEHLVVTVQKGGQEATLAHSAPGASTGTFSASAHHDEDGSLDQGRLGAGDVAVVRIGLDAAGLVIRAGDAVSILMEHAGTSIHVDLRVGAWRDELVIPL